MRLRDGWRSSMSSGRAEKEQMYTQVKTGSALTTLGWVQEWYEVFDAARSGSREAQQNYEAWFPAHTGTRGSRGRGF